MANKHHSRSTRAHKKGVETASAALAVNNLISPKIFSIVVSSLPSGTKLCRFRVFGNSVIYFFNVELSIKQAPKAMTTESTNRKQNPDGEFSRIKSYYKRLRFPVNAYDLVIAVDNNKTSSTSAPANATPLESNIRKQHQQYKTYREVFLFVPIASSYIMHIYSLDWILFQHCA